LIKPRPEPIIITAINIYFIRGIENQDLIPKKEEIASVYSNLEDYF
jgi:hypothetical protein